MSDLRLLSIPMKATHRGEPCIIVGFLPRVSPLSALVVDGAGDFRVVFVTDLTSDWYHDGRSWRDHDETEDATDFQGPFEEIPE